MIRSYKNDIHRRSRASEHSKDIAVLQSAGSHLPRCTDLNPLEPCVENRLILIYFMLLLQ